MRTMPPAARLAPMRPPITADRAGSKPRLDHAAAANPNPGAPLLHRLNRTEYANAIEDLLGLNVDVDRLCCRPMIPLSASTTMPMCWAFRRCCWNAIWPRRTASAPSRSAIPTPQPGSDTYRARQDLSQDQHIEGLPFGTVGGMAVEHTFPLDAEYEFRLSMFRNNLEIMRGIERPASNGVVDRRRAHFPARRLAAPTTWRRCAIRPMAPTRSTRASVFACR